MKRILITGKNSYIGTKIMSFLAQFEGEYEIDELDMESPNWKAFDFSSYIGKANGIILFCTTFFNPLIHCLARGKGKYAALCNKAFGSLVYSFGPIKSLY